jgi:hypothetical protein
MVYAACVVAGIIVGAAFAFFVDVVRCCPNSLDEIETERL